MKQGLSEVIGSWKIIAMSLPTIRRRLPADRPRRFCPAKVSRSALTRAVQGKSPMTASMSTLLPEPEFADDRDHVALVDREIDPVDRLERSAEGRKLDREALDLEQRHGSYP